MRTTPTLGAPDLAALVSQFQSEDKCRSYLEELRWPDGVRCPRCDASKGISRIRTRDQFECASCGYQFSVRAGTILHDSHLPLWKWFLAVYVIGESDHGVPATQLRSMLGVSYKTAWYLSHRIRAALKEEGRESMRTVAQQVPGPYHHLSDKHLPAYLDEAAFRSRNRRNAYRFPHLLKRLVEAESVTYSELVADT
jgi:transposase-like protein